MPILPQKFREETRRDAPKAVDSRPSTRGERRGCVERSDARRALWWVVVSSWSGGLSCTSTPPPVEAAAPQVSTEPTASAPAAPRTPNDERGARLFDNFRAEKVIGGRFAPDSSKTEELDGTGGPNGNGTLNDGSGKPLPNTGHDYRLKNFFGWDLRGAEGIYGREYHNKSFVTTWNLLSDTRSPAELRSWLEKGDEHIPAYGEILDGRDLDDIVAFLVKTRSRELAHPDGVFRLDASAPKGYQLLTGADVQRGHERYTATCAACHGTDGTSLVIDETQSAGAISRTSGYEIWFKIQHGHPDSSMLRQANEGDGAANSRAVLELLAALCDRVKYPALTGQSDVPDGDSRCGEYLR